MCIYWPHNKMHKEGQTIGTMEELQHEEVMNIDMAIDINKVDPAFV